MLPPHAVRVFNAHSGIAYLQLLSESTRIDIISSDASGLQSFARAPTKLALW